MAKVYISFGQQDAVFVKLLVQEMEKAPGLDPVLVKGRLDGSMPWLDAADGQLDACEVLLAIMSPQARSSDFATYEWATAAAKGKPIVSLIIRPGALHPRLATLPTIDFTKGPAWGALFEALNATLEPTAASAVKPAQPINEDEDQPTADMSEIGTLPPDTPVTIREAYESLNSFDPTTRETAIATLTSADHPAAADALSLALKHPNREIRWEAVKALAAIDDKRALPGLLEMLSSKNEQDTWDAAWSIVRIGGVEIVDGITNEMRKEGSAALRSGTWALGQLGIGIKDKVFDLMDDEETNMRLASVEVLTEMGAPILPEVVGMIGSDNELRRDSVVRVVRNFEEESIPLLVQALESEGETRRTAGRTLISIGDRAVMPVAEVLRNPNYRMRKAAEQILKNINTPLAREELEIWQEEQQEG